MTEKQYRLTTENMKWFVQQKLEPAGGWINISKHFSEEAARAKINELIKQQIKDSVRSALFLYDAAGDALKDYPHKFRC